MMSLKEVIVQLSQRLAKISDSARLDCELLISQVLLQSRAWVLANPAYRLTDLQWRTLQTLAARRANGEPMAYLLGYQEFWGLRLRVNPQVLVPPPEPEHLIEWILDGYSDH